MNTQLTLKTAKVNDGTVRDSERPLWVGTSAITDNVNGRLVTLSVTVDKDWLWARLSAEPSEKYKGKLLSAGFTYSRKRMGWHALVSELACSTLRSFGATTVTHHAVVSLPPSTLEVNRKDHDVDVDMNERKPTGKRTQTVLMSAEEAVKVAATKSKPVASSNEPTEVASKPKVTGKTEATLLAVIEEQRATNKQVSDALAQMAAMNQQLMALLSKQVAA